MTGKMGSMFGVIATNADVINRMLEYHTKSIELPNQRLDYLKKRGVTEFEEKAYKIHKILTVIDQIKDKEEREDAIQDIIGEMI